MLRAMVLARLIVPPALDTALFSTGAIKDAVITPISTRQGEHWVDYPTQLRVFFGAFDQNHVAHKDPLHLGCVQFACCREVSLQPI